MTFSLLSCNRASTIVFNDRVIQSHFDSLACSASKMIDNDFLFFQIYITKNSQGHKIDIFAADSPLMDIALPMIHPSTHYRVIKGFSSRCGLGVVYCEDLFDLFHFIDKHSLSPKGLIEIYKGSTRSVDKVATMRCALQVGKDDNNPYVRVFHEQKSFRKQYPVYFENEFCSLSFDEAYCCITYNPDIFELFYDDVLIIGEWCHEKNDTLSLTPQLIYAYSVPKGEFEKIPINKVDLFKNNNPRKSPILDNWEIIVDSSSVRLFPFRNGYTK